MPDGSVESLAADIAAAETVVALTGAGVSTASGVPTFRGPDGLWERLDRRDFEYRRFRRDPAGFWRDRIELRAALLGDDGITPNAAHEALATLETAGHLDAVLTQNVDGLHHAAGSETVIELHGTNRAVECVECGTRAPAEPVFERARDGEVPPRCRECQGILKPATVLFGEPMPEPAIRRAEGLAEESDVFLAIGSSLRVRPAADLPDRARRTDATVAVLNLEPTPVSGRADYDLRADVTEALPALAATLA